MFKRTAILLMVLFFVIQVADAQSEIGFSKIQAPALTSEGKGAITHIEVEINEGKGRILVDTSPYTGVQTQYSERIAVSVAQFYTGINISGYDIIFTFKTEALVVDGASAGAAMAVATIAALLKKEVREDAVITGTIAQDGSIGPVGGIIEKAEASSTAGNKLFLIPQGQEIQAYTVEKVETPMPGWTIVRREMQYLNVTDYAAKNLNMTIVQVARIEDAVDILLNGLNLTKKIEAPVALELEKVNVSERAERMRTLAQIEISGAEKAIKDAEAVVERLADESLQKAAEEILARTTTELEEAKIALEKNYLYSAANHGFRARVYSNFARDYSKYSALGGDEQVKFLGNRIAEVNSKIKNAKSKISGIEELSKKENTLEWAVAAQERFAQAEEQFAKRTNESSETLYNLALAEGWADISLNFYNALLGIEKGKTLGLDVFKNMSESAIIRAEGELNKFGVKSKTEWFLLVAKRENSYEWYYASYIDASIASIRAETSQEFKLKPWNDIVSYVDSEIEKVNTSSSVWAELYRDHAKLLLYYAKKEQSIDLLEDALVYAREAQVYSDAYSTALRSQKIPISFDGNVIIFTAALLVIAIIFMLFRVFSPKSEYY